MSRNVADADDGCLTGERFLDPRSGSLVTDADRLSVPLEQEQTIAANEWAEPPEEATAWKRSRLRARLEVAIAPPARGSFFIGADLWSR